MLPWQLRVARAVAGTDDALTDDIAAADQLARAADMGDIEGARMLGDFGSGFSSDNGVANIGHGIGKFGADGAWIKPVELIHPGYTRALLGACRNGAKVWPAWRGVKDRIDPARAVKGFEAWVKIVCCTANIHAHPGMAHDDLC